MLTPEELGVWRQEGGPAEIAGAVDRAARSPLPRGPGDEGTAQRGSSGFTLIEH